MGIAQALLNDPKILIVDEPTVGLDPQEQIQFRNLLSSIAPQLLLMKQGRLCGNVEPEYLIEGAQGHVFECRLSAKELMQIQQSYMVTSSLQRSDGIYAKVLAEKKPCLEAEQTMPSLEDAYLWFNGTEKGRSRK